MIEGEEGGSIGGETSSFSCRNLVVTQPGTYTLTIQRMDGLMLTAATTYSLVTGATVVSAGQISLSPALATRHYTAFLSRTLTFTPTTSQVRPLQRGDARGGVGGSGMFVAWGG